MEYKAPVRLVICVDGTWCDPDGPALSDKAQRNITNVYRFCASVKKGLITDKHGEQYQQEKKYIQGIASKDGIRWTRRLREGAFGNECKKQIKEVYRECCRLSGPGDQVWLYGFSRGAYVVRAVAGLLHYIRSLTSADGPDKAFDADYEEALAVYRKMQKQAQLGAGQIHSMLASSTRPAPAIQFVGLFDTVKAVDDDQLFDISFNDSIRHLRHALALNENRQQMLPEYMYPNFSHTRSLVKRSFVQSWFLGAHIDIGGSSEKDGLSLYPLQWMFLESRDAGLYLEFDGDFGGRAKIHNPLELVGLECESSSEPWSCTMDNQLVVNMLDIRHLHEEDASPRFRVQINRAKGIWTRRDRQPFDSGGTLNGYCSFAPQGTIIHPSVYLVIDVHLSISAEMQDVSFYKKDYLEKWRQPMLGQKGPFPNLGFWQDTTRRDPEDPGAIRILVCGNTGVGKSTLVNKVFGVPEGKEVTGSSNRVRGLHDVKEEITWAGRPDLIIHDSGGFEAAGVEEFEAIEDFLKAKGNEVEIDKRLHAIWFCLEANNPRPTQKATEYLFRTISSCAQDVPVIIIATKRDEFLGAKGQEARSLFERDGKEVTLKDMDNYAEEQLQVRLQQIQDEIHGLEGGSFYACVAVSKDKDESFRVLSKTTEDCFDQDRVRLLYIRAQVARIDSKINLALAETMRIYKRVLASSVGVAGLPFANSANRMSAAIDVCRTIITCFGMPQVTPELAFQLCKANLWDDVGNGLAVIFAESIAAAGVFGTAATAGLPFFLIPMAINIPLVVPATTRLLLMLSCDLILIFIRSFREASAKCITQPEVTDLRRAITSYHSYCKEVHFRVSQLLPKRNVVKSFQVGKVKVGITEIIEEFRKRVMDEVASPEPRFSNFTRLTRHGSSSAISSSYSETIVGDKEDIEEALGIMRNQAQDSDAMSTSELAEVQKMMNESHLGTSGRDD